MAYEKGDAYIGKDFWSDEGQSAVMLPHSCDEWVIGGVKEVDELISDLTDLKKTLVEKGEL